MIDTISTEIPGTPGKDCHCGSQICMGRKQEIRGDVPGGTGKPARAFDESNALQILKCIRSEYRRDGKVMQGDVIDRAIRAIRRAGL